uniref:Uncharacterized protein n=1 Tax=Lactuca sativa TaxID=4236 RepID=A0A9R1WKS8_LACSA|nr:hypothetical protein LSAT_V11C100032190 [Lactuca sativa]
MQFIKRNYPIGDIAERFHALCLKDSGVLYEDHYVQICIKAEWRNHQGRLVLLLGNKNTGPLDSVQAVVFFNLNVLLNCLEVLLFLTSSTSLEINWYFIIVVVRGVRPMSLGEMENLFNTLRLMVCPGLSQLVGKL